MEEGKSEFSGSGDGVRYGGGGYGSGFESGRLCGCGEGRGRRRREDREVPDSYRDFRAPRDERYREQAIRTLHVGDWLFAFSLSYWVWPEYAHRRSRELHYPPTNVIDHAHHDDDEQH